MPNTRTQSVILAGFSTIEQNGKIVERTPRYMVANTRQADLYWGGPHWGYPNDLGKRDVGGDFGLSYGYGQSEPTNVGKIQGGTVFSNYHYEGSLMNNCSFVGGWGSGDARSFAAEAYRKMRPDKPSFEGLNAIYELKDLPGMLRQRLSDSPFRNIGNYYLAEKFGWVPLLRDIQNLCKTQENLQDRYKQLLRDEGEPIRRGTKLRDLRSDPLISNWNPGMGPSLVSYFSRGPVTVQSSQQTMDQVWAAARFRYFLPEGPRDIVWTNRMKRAIFGLTPSPIVIWNAVPWSWLADWFFNYGDVISNLSSTIADRCAAEYFYMMRHQAVSTTYTITSGAWESYSMKPIDVITTSSTMQGNKTRLRGDPFGLATNQNSLNGTQLAILGALGLSRL
jgi:hypothetical protein